MALKGIRWGKAGLGAASGCSLKASGEQHYKQEVVNIWLVTYWSYGKYFPGWSYKNRWEYIVMGKILSSFSSFSSLNQRGPMRKGCRSSLCHPAGSLAQVHNWRLNPSLWSLWINEAHQKMKASRGSWQGQRPEQIHEPCLCLHGSMKRKSAVSHWDT